MSKTCKIENSSNLNLKQKLKTEKGKNRKGEMKWTYLAYQTEPGQHSPNKPSSTAYRAAQQRPSPPPETDPRTPSSTER
jgi:hypothetical protein